MHLPAVWIVQRTVNSVLNKQGTAFDTLNDLFRNFEAYVDAYSELQTNERGIASELFANFIVDAMLFLLASNSRRILSNLDPSEESVREFKAYANALRVANLTPCVEQLVNNE